MSKDKDKNKAVAKWTPEPWHVGEYGGSIEATWNTGQKVQVGILSATHWTGANAQEKRNDARMREETKHNAARIVAAVNFCAGHADLDECELVPKGTLAALREFARGHIDVSRSAVIYGYPRTEAMLDSARSILSRAAAQKGGE